MTMLPLRVHHIAFAESTDETTLRTMTSLLGLSVAHTEEGDGFVERLLPVGDCSIQSLTATGDGVVQRFLARRGPGLHHIAFEVADLTTALAELAGSGADLIDQVPRMGGAGTKIAFIHPRTFGGVLVELVQEVERPA